MRELALFAGAGGGILGGKLLGWRTVCAVEIDPYCRNVLMARQNDGCLEPFPIWDDVRTFDGRPWRGAVDVVSGGFPCQDISSAGKGAGIDGEKSGLWSEFARIIGEVGPRYVFVENSPMLTARGLGRVLGDLAAMGFDAEWGVLGAHHVGAPHRRDRIWIAAANSQRELVRHESGRIGWPSGSGEAEPCDDGPTRTAANAHGHGQYDVTVDAKVAGASADDGPTRTATWVKCGGCEDYWCVAHDRHAFDCECPHVDEWESSPYQSMAYSISELGEFWTGEYGRRVAASDRGRKRGDGIQGGVDPDEGINPSKRLARVETAGPFSSRSGEREDIQRKESWWLIEPDVGRVADGVASRMDRLRAIGNGQVPAVVALAWRTLMRRMNDGISRSG